jgi:hypothetical protein
VDHPILSRAGRYLPTYPTRVQSRIDQAEREYGDAWRQRQLRTFADECAEEGEDVAGWLVWIIQRLDEVPADKRAEVTRLVEDLIGLGAQVTAKADRLAALLAHHTHPIDPGGNVDA